jgi:surfeit locus 1 family protein
MLVTLCLTLLLLLALGTWQVQRLGWKRDLMAQVESRIHAGPVAVESARFWLGMDVEAHAYQRIQVAGRLLHDKRLFVYASTALGAGYWLLVPMVLRDDPQSAVWINMGYVSNAQRRLLLADPTLWSDSTLASSMSIVGLLRTSEPDHVLLRKNVPDEKRWYIRSVEQMTGASGLAEAGLSTAPFFVDADRVADPAAYPVGGLTQIRFNNNHLVYALTWYFLAAMNAGVLIYLLRTEWRSGRS